MKNLSRLPLIVSLVVAVSLLFGSEASGQIRMFTTQPVVDSFPIVKIGVSVTDSGRPAVGVSAANFAVTEDGSPVSGLALEGCYAPQAAAIAVLTDVSSSMYWSAGNGNWNAYYNSYSQFLAEVPPPSQLALIPFTDTVTRYFPGNARPSGFFSAGVQADTTEFMDSLKNLLFQGNTNVDDALVYAVGVLQQSALQRKVIVLVTDDAVLDRSGVYQYLSQNGITLFVMELDPDTLHSNYDLALALGGKYFVAGDSSQYLPSMQEIGKSFLAEQCTLRYISTNPCAWYADHGVTVALNYKGATPYTRLGYTLGRDTRDTIAPVISIDSSIATSRQILAREIFPCQTGIKFFSDSALVNFAKLRQRRTMPDSSWDSLVVVDSTLPAHGYYLAIDSAGNVRRVLLSYVPKPDINPPQLPLANIVSGSCTQNVTEQLPWDRGIMSIVLDPGARNLVLDSVRYFSRSFARAYLRVPILKDSSHGCLTATDSVGHTNTECYQWNGEGGDTLPPLFNQDVLAEPRTSLSGRVTELRKGDVGLQQVILQPLVNTTLPVVTYASPFSSTVAVTLTDSLYPATCAVDAMDSAGNRMADTLRYQPIADILPPQLIETAPSGSTRLISVTETRPWDRGLRSIAVAGAPVNITPGPITFVDPRHGSILMTVVNALQPATATVVATDSLGNQASIDIIVTPGGPIPLEPLSITTPLDFGSITATTQATLPALLTNPNASDVTVTRSAILGDDSVFTLQETLPITIQAKQSLPLHFIFRPNWLGAWKATQTLSNDTMLLATIDLLGRSTGELRVELDTVQLSKAGDLGAMTLRMEATPPTLNIDTINFTLAWDHDLADLGMLTQQCGASALDTGLCNYVLSATPLPNGDQSYQLIRKSKLSAPTLALGTNSMAIPIKGTYVTRATASAVSFTATSAGSFVTSTGNAGMISVGSICADSTIRAHFDGMLGVVVSAVQPNPSHDQLQITLRAEHDMNCRISLLSMLGHKAFQEEIALSAGLQYHTIAVAQLPSGDYILRVRGADGSVSSLRVVVLH